MSRNEVFRFCIILPLIVNMSGVGSIIAKHIMPSVERTARRLLFILSGLEVMAPSGYRAALRIQEFSIHYDYETYPVGWAELYRRNRLYLQDPVIRWAFLGGD